MSTRKNKRTDDLNLLAEPTSTGPDLRHRAEVKMRQNAQGDKDVETLSAEESRNMLHELRVHQIELEMQNEELRRTQAELEASRARYFDLYELAPVGYFTLNEKGIILEANLRTAILLGIPKTALAKRALSQFILPEDQDIYYLHHKRLYATGEPQVCEMRMMSKHGAPFWARLEATLAQDSNTGERICRAAISDITEGKRVAEEALRESERKYFTLFSEMDAGCALHELVTDPTGAPVDYVTLEVNKAFERLVQVEKSDIVGQKASAILPRDEFKKWLGIFAPVASTGKSTHYEMYSPSNGKYFEGNAYCPEKGKFAVTFTDVSERKRAENALRESEERWRSLVNATPDYIALHDQEGRFLFLNHYAEGFTEKDVIGSSVYQYLLPESVELFRSGVEKALNTWTTQRFEHTALGDRGATRTYEEYLVPLRGKNQEINTLAVSRDITERKRAEDTLRTLLIRHEALLAALPEIVVEVDKQKVFTWANQAGLEFYGADVIGKEAVFYFEGEQDTYQTVDPLFNGSDQTIYVESWQRRKDGQKRLLAWWCRALKDKNGNVTGALSSARDITEGKQMEQALRLSEQTARQLYEQVQNERNLANALIDHLPGGFGLVDQQGRVARWNKYAETITGYTLEEMRNLDISSVLPVEEQARLADWVAQVFASGHISIDTQLISKPGGEKTPIYLTGSRVQIGSEAYLLVIGMDITELKRAEQAIQASEARFSTVFHASPLSIAITRLNDNTFIDVNEAWQKMVGFDHSEAVGRTPLILNAWVDLGERDRLVRQLHQEGMVQGFEFQMRQKSGAILDCLISAVQIEVAGEPCMLSMSLDISERKQMENTLRESEQRLSTLFHKSPLGIGLFDSKNHYIDVNEMLCVMLGYTREELLRRTDLDITHPDDRAMSRSLFEYMVNGSNRGYNTQKRYLKKDRSSMWVNLTTGSVNNSAGGFIYGIGIVEDITERKSAEESIQRKNQELNMLNQIGQAISRLMPPSEIMELLYTSIGQTLDERNVYIALYDETSQSISFPIYTVDGKRSQPTSRPFSNGLTEYILRTRKPVLISHNIKAFLKEHHIESLGIPSRSYLGAPMRIGDRVLGIIAIQDYDKEDAFEEGDMELLGTIAGQAAIALENSRLYGEIQRELNERKQAEEALRESRDRLAHLSRRLVQAQEQERRHLAFELHDEVGQTLTALYIMLNGVAQASEDAIVQEKTARLQDLMRSLINQISALSMELHPRDLDALGLLPGLIALFHRVFTQTRIDIDFKHNILGNRRFTPEIEITTYRIIQEALTNVIRHSGVLKASVRLQADDDALWLQIQDEGKGFDLQKGMIADNSMGLLSIMERAEQINGCLSIDTAPGEGVNITCTLPLNGDVKGAKDNEL